MSNKYTWTNEMYQAMVDRAEAAEARAEKSEAERDALRADLNELQRRHAALTDAAMKAARERDEARRKLQTTQHVLRYWLREGRFLVSNCDEYNNAIDMLRSVVEVES